MQTGSLMFGMICGEGLEGAHDMRLCEPGKIARKQTQNGQKMEFELSYRVANSQLSRVLNEFLHKYFQ
ncbi:hypothetical protein PsAD46_04329 [Pseudovibrio sp. Ad46]|nr:hypothetical protein PsAD46_04329 [Pseudovibrio sp. Ad46]KZL00638.1 hypothetical protein PsW74_02238 [Pseudovibrio sp. W74]KZL06828.1 hypothetical protein PsAD14_04287 [Pseudovibrio sp. Ad14]